MNPWIVIVAAGIFEACFAFCLGKAKQTSGTIMLFWYLGFIITLSCSMLLLIKANQTLPIGTAYAIWTGIGAVGTAILGILFFNEPTSFLRLIFISTLIFSIVGLKYVS